MLELDGITIATPQRVLMRDLGATVAAGTVLAVMGESGAGKSALLALLAGTLAPAFRASGRIRLDGRDIGGLPTVQRRVGMLFQDDLLFPHMTVLENLLFALPGGAGRAQRIEQAERALQRAGLEGHAARWPASLSGGQRARVSVLRALLAEPRALLLDEPFSRLDSALRERFRGFVFERLREQRIPAVLVTHDLQDVPAGAQLIRLDAESRVLDRVALRLLRPALDGSARRLQPLGVHADHVTLLGFAVGLAAALAIGLRHFDLGLALLLASRLCDGIDGALARLAAPTDRGGFLDITLDFLFYASIPLGFAFADPAANALAAAALLAAFIGTATTFLAFAAVAAKRGLQNAAYPGKGLYYLGGLTEATETLTCFVLMCLLPGLVRGLCAGVRAVVRADDRDPALGRLAHVHAVMPRPATAEERPAPQPARQRGWRNRLLLLGVLVAAVVAFFVFGGARYLDLDWVKQRQGEFAALYAANPLVVIAAFFGVYVVVTALSLPAATLMTLTAGAIFGLLIGTVVVSFAASIGATLAFLGSRYLFRDIVERRFATRMAEIDRGIERDGAFYLFMLRLVPIVPFFLINLLMGLTRLKVGIFYLVTQVAMLAGTAVYVNAGTQLASTQSLRDIVSPALLGSLALLGFFPLIAKKLAEDFGHRQRYARWRAAEALRPQPDRDRRRRRRPGLELHRRGGQGARDPGRKPADGRRLPELRLRAEQGADPHRDAGAADAARRALRHRATPRPASASPT